MIPSANILGAKWEFKQIHYLSQLKGVLESRTEISDMNID